MHRGDSEQTVQAAGCFQFTLTLAVALSNDLGVIDRSGTSLSNFEMVVPALDHRVFIAGGVAVTLHQKT